MASDTQTTTPVTDPDKLPWPGEELACRVTGGTDRTNFFDSGRQSVRDLQAVLSLIHRDLADYPTILDFGSGCGRIMLWLEHLAATCSLHGVDIDSRAIAWSQQNMPWATFKVNQPLPPLDYPTGYFDLVFNHSVFTHIDEDYQDQWLSELQRVVKPGGHLVLSVHGEAAFLDFERNVIKAGGDPSVVRHELATKGLSFIHDDAFTGGPFPDFYHSTFHAPWYIHQHWGRYFNVSAYVTRGSMGFQDFVLLQRRSDDTERPSPITVSASVPSTKAVSSSPGTNGLAASPSGSPSGLEPDDALHRLGGRLHRGFVPAAAAGTMARFLRRLGDRLDHGRADYQRQVDANIFDALWELNGELRTKTHMGGVPVAELNARLWDAVRLQGQRINRLEADLWDALRSRPADDS